MSLRFGKNAIVGAFLFLLACQVARGQSPQTDLTKVQLEDLMNIEVTSVAKKEQKLSRTASAVFVITQEDIRRSGATNIPDLLRMVPGLDVAQIDSSTWAISARGLNGQVANKLQVLIDGRTVYSPLFSGVFWDDQIVPLENIDRIEVIRGPGAAVWGANAVNGVINVITKKASDTQGLFLTVGGGTYEHGFGSARYGGRLGGKVEYRASLEGFARSHLSAPVIHNGQDEWNLVQGGLRIDARPSSKDTLVFEGDAHSGTAGEKAAFGLLDPPPINGSLAVDKRFSGWDLLSRWNHVATPHSATSLQVYFDRSTRGDTLYSIGINVFDLDFQHSVSWGDRQEIVWGVGGRVNSVTSATTSRLWLGHPRQTSHLYTSFIQDELSILPHRLYLSIGARLEHNDYTGFGVQPSARISWTPSERQMFWAAVSRADRTPSVADTDMRVNIYEKPGAGTLPVLASDFGNPKFKNENLRAVELGNRSQLNPRLSLDSAIFFNSYQDLVSTEPAPPFLESTNGPPHIVNPASCANLDYGETHGLEVSANWRVAERWTLSPSYSYLGAHFHREASSKDSLTATTFQGSSPDHQWQLRSHVNLRRHLEWNASAFFVGSLSNQGVPAYTRVDTNVAWTPTQHFSLLVAGQNLQKDRHPESNSVYSTVLPSLIKHSGYVKIMWQF